MPSDDELRTIARKASTTGHYSGGVKALRAVWAASRVTPTREHVAQAVPDALESVRAERDMALTDKFHWHEVATKAKDQRDAALAAIERVRAEHSKSDYDGGICLDCEKPWPCSTLAALDGAPEPEWEYSRGVLQESGLLCTGVGLSLDQVVNVRRRPAGPWEPVEGESK